MPHYEVTANGALFGLYQAVSEQEARDKCAKDAGYASESDMVKQLERPSELAANLVPDATAEAAP